MKRSLGFAVSLVLVAAACREPRETSVDAGAGHPPVILVTIDTLRADRVGVYGGPQGITPNLDALSRRGVRFADATAQAPLTLPSHASILTGQFPSVHGIRDNTGFILPKSVATLADILRANGYRTAAFVGSFLLNGAATGFGRGFDQYGDDFPTGRRGVSYADLQKPGTAVVHEALAWLGSSSTANVPVFLWVHLYDPHAPYDAPKAFTDRFPTKPYNAEVATADWAVGELLNGLPSTVATRAIIVATADHGESLDDHGEPEHGIFLYDATLRVPLIIAGVGVPAARVIDEQVRHVDLVPTILDLLGIKSSQALSGVSLVPVMRGGHRADVPISYSESWFGQLHFGWSELGAVRTGDWKFVKAPRPELYNLRNDPQETRNLIGERPEVAARLDQAVEAARGARSVGSTAPVDSAALERLRSLGYVGGGGTGISSDSVPGADPKDRIREYVAFVDAFYAALDDLEASRNARALERFRELARKHPLSFEAHQYVGRALVALGRYGDAVKEYEVVQSLKPDLAIGYVEAAGAEVERKNYAAATRLLEQGLALEPDSFHAYYVKGRVDLGARRPAAARAAFERALAINPRMALAHYELGVLDEEAGDRVKALEHYRQALSADEDFVEARRAVAHLEAAATRTP